ncbi:unnamed protein product [Lasius platythorax]|uniref:Uncharacterized protein n=1 Tax=Lasius platythorax TaxID=488582 RepID=A0AAV2NXC8_9HYME
MVQQNNCTNNWKNFKYKLQLQDNESNTSTEKKLILCYNLEQQRLILENENLKSRLLTIEKAKCDIATSAAQLENKLLLQEEKMQNVLSAHEEKKILVKVQ